MKNKTILLITGLLFLQLNLSYAQLVSGVVYGKQSENELTLPGVNVHWAESTIGTITNDQGEFELFKPSKYSKLVFSFVGYTSDTIYIDKASDDLKIILFAGENLEAIQIIERTPGTHIDRLNPILTEKITGAELCKAACCNLSESFETNASVDAYYANAATGARQIRLLGLDGQYVQMLTENIPNMRGLAKPYGLAYIPGPWMDGIHVSKGTSSVKSGYESITGQINIEYLKPETADLFYFNAFVSSMGRKETNLTGSAILNKKISTLLLAHVSGNNMREDFSGDGFMDYPLISQYNFLNRWRYAGENLQVIMGVKALKEQRISGQIDFDPEGQRGMDYPYGIGIETERLEGFLKVAYVFNNDLNSNFGSIYSFTGHNQDSYFGLRDYVAIERNLYVNLMFQTDIVNEKHNLTSGFSLVRDVLNELLDEEELNFTESVPGVFTEYAFNPNPKITLLGGVRLDYSSIYGFAFTPRLHGRYSPGASTTFRFSTGKGYRTPHVLAEQNHFLASSRRIILADNFDREEAWNYGISMTQYIGSGPRQLSLNLEAYRTSFMHQVIMDLDSSVDEVQFYNLDGRSFSNNYQVELSANPFKGLESRVALRYSDVRYEWNGDLLIKPLVSKYKGLVNFSYTTPLKKWQIDYTLQINGPGRIPDTSGNPADYQIDSEFPSYSIMNAQITKYFKTWNIYVGAENLTGFRQENPILAADQPFGEFFDASLIWGPIDGRKIYAGLRFAIGRIE